jgi:hypothetical protein
VKEKVYRAKARLLLLQETVIGGDLSKGARATIIHKNDMGGQFALESVAYALDGTPVFSRADANGDLANQKEIEVFSGRVLPGNHQVTVRMTYRGRGFGVFSYLEGYQFKLQSNQTFTVEPGKLTTLKVVGYEKGGLTADLKDRPSIRYDVTASTEGDPPGPSALAR